METKFKIYSKKTITVDGVSLEIITQVANLTRDDVVKALAMSVQQRDWMQELVDGSTRKLALIDEAIAYGSDSVVL